MLSKFKKHFKYGADLLHKFHSRTAMQEILQASIEPPSAFLRKPMGAEFNTIYKQCR